MTDTDIHSCSYHCDRHACIEAQRNELRDKLFEGQAVKTYSGGKPNYTQPIEQHEFIDTTAKWGRDFVEVLNPLKENEILRVYHERPQQPKQEPYNPLENNADYERGFIDGMQKQMQSSVDKAVNKMTKREWVGLTKEELEFYTEELGQGELGRGVLRAVDDFLKEKNGG
jgi:hypothetical protein